MNVHRGEWNLSHDRSPARYLSNGEVKYMINFVIPPTIPPSSENVLPVPLIRMYHLICGSELLIMQCTTSKKNKKNIFLLSLILMEL